ncbi:MAG: nitrilase-related carbon-nitrogen hydrolase [Bacteroidales bacterium]|nr:nitrilase-related carbon-nitrogen hydrolase [Bacteroidales bacterium]
MLKIALIQFEPLLGNIAANIITVRELIGRLSGAQLVVLPELASTGYHFNNPEHAISLAEDPGNSEYVAMLTDLASKNNQFIVSGFNEKSKSGIYNSSLLIGPEGLMGIYRKMHLFMHEKEYFLPGDGELAVYDTGHCRLGMQICFDYLFPEPWRILSQKGAELIVHPSNLLTQNANKVLPGLALINHVYIATTNRIGIERDLEFNGGSMILDPKGEILVKASASAEELIEYEIDISLAHNKMITSMNHVFEDRRPEQYKQDIC